jgi:hypothetical protein
MASTNVLDTSVQAFDHGERTSIGATALQLTTTSFAARQGVEIRADAANGANFVYVGNSDVTAGGTDATDGFKLAAGERVFIPIDDPSKVWVIGSTTGLAVSWVAY